MSVHVKHWEWKSPEECLQWLFENHSDMKHYGRLHLWQESFATLGGGCLAGSYTWVNPKKLENRVYSVHWSNDAVAIRYHDEIFASVIPNRKYPDKTRCVLLRLPTPEAV